MVKKGDILLCIKKYNKLHSEFEEGKKYKILHVDEFYCLLDSIERYLHLAQAIYKNEIKNSFLNITERKRKIKKLNENKN